MFYACSLIDLIFSQKDSRKLNREFTLGDIMQGNLKIKHMHNRCLSPHEIRVWGVCASTPLNHDIGCVVPRPHALIDGLTRDQLGDEATHEGIPGSVRVHQQLLGERDDGEEADLAQLGHCGGVHALGDDHGARSVTRGLGQPRDLEGDLRAIISVPSLGLGKGDSLRMKKKKNRVYG